MANNISIRDGNGNPATLVTVDTGVDVHVPLHGRFYPDKPDTTGTLSAAGNTVALNVANITGLVIAVSTSAVAGCAATFEYSLDSTNGTDGVWYQVQAQRSNALDTFESGFTNFNATPVYTWNLPVSGVNWFRIRCTAITSGSLNVRLSPCDDLMFPSRTPSTLAVSGTAAHDAAVSGNPVRIATKAVATMPAVVSAANDVADTLATMQGVPLVTLDAVPAQRLRSSIWLTTTSDVVLFAAQASGLRSHLTDIQVVNTGTAVELIIKDGTTEIWRLPLPQNVPVALNGIRSALMSTAATALNATLSAAGTVRVNAQGYVAV